MSASGTTHGVEWRIPEDRCSVLCRTHDDFHGEATVEEIVRVFKGAGVVVQINTVALEELLKNPTSEWIVVATAQPPIPPTHGSLEYFVDPFHLDRTAKISSDGAVDYKHLNLILNVTKGQPLVRKHDPIPGKPGQDVFGKMIPPLEPKTASIPVGEGIEVIEAGHLAVAGQDGALTTRAKGIAISKAYTVGGDVSYKTGNIEFNGSIDVGGNVLSGFELKAEGDIIVRGIVEAAKLEALGSITILGGIHGGSKGIIRSGGHLTARFANDATLEVDGDVTIQSQIVNCHILAHGTVALTGNPGAIIGGEIRAGERISCSFAGASGGAKTLLQIGLDNDLPRKISHHEEEGATLKKQLDEIEKTLEQVQAVKERVGSLPPAQEAVRVKVVQEKFLIRGRIELIQKELTTMKAELAKAREGSVEIKDTVYTGTTVKLGGDVYGVDHDLRYTTFYYERGEIHTRAD
jgi:uncharacterized protein